PGWTSPDLNGAVSDASRHELPRLGGVRCLAAQDLLELVQPAPVLLPGHAVEKLESLDPRGGETRAPLPSGQLAQDLAAVDHLAVEEGELGTRLARGELVELFERGIDGALACRM